MRRPSKIIFYGITLVSFSLLQFTRGNYLVEDSRRKNYSFSNDFMFGVSTAAYQIEGAWNEGGKGESIWDKYLHDNPDYTKDGTNADIAADSYHHYMEDVKMIKNLSVGYYRTSIFWPRILPDGTDNNINREGVMYYRRLFKELLKANITPIITLYHWDMPTLFADLGGWSNPLLVDYFEDYAWIAFNLFGDLIKHWLTVNEPHQHCVSSYGGTTVPGLSSPGVALYLCAHHMLLAHARAYRLYEKEFRYYQKGEIAISLDCTWSSPKHDNRLEDQEAAEQHFEMHVGLFSHPIFSKAGDYPGIVRERVDNASYKQGFSRSRLPYFTNEEVYAPGFRHMINWVTKKYGKEVPIIVTENGVGDRGQLDDYDRVSYFNEYLYQLQLAIYEDGCNVKGYFAWTLMDNFEWEFGYTEKFGLYKVDYSSPNRTRTPKLSAKSYENIVRTRRIDFNYMKQPTDYHQFQD